MTGRWVRTCETDIDWVDGSLTADLLAVVEGGRRGHEWALEALHALADVVAPPAPDPEPLVVHDARIYQLWRNRHCPDHDMTGITCFGTSVSYVTARDAYGCATITQLQDEVRGHPADCRCWKSSVIRHHALLQEDR